MTRLHPEDLRELARLIADELRGESFMRIKDSSTRVDDSMLTAKQVADRLGTSVETVYRNQVKLGAKRLSDSPRARLRFPAEHLAESLTSPSKSSPPVEPKRTKPRRRRQSRGDLLPIKGES